MATFSVIVPVYNAEKTLVRCVESIVASGGDAVEIILIEDCSKDQSWQVCQELEERYCNVKCLRNKKNCGVSHTRNRGLEEAAGTYLLFVDSDDWVDENYVPRFQKALADHQLKLAICGYVNHDEKYAGRTDVFAWEEFVGERQTSLREEIDKLHSGQVLQQLWNKVFINEIVQKHQIRFDETISIGEDTRFVLEYIRKGDIETAWLINEPLYHYMRDQEGSLMYRVGYESVEEPLKNQRKLYEIMGLPQREIEKNLAADRQKQIELYAYLIMHNAGMGLREKYRLITALNASQGRDLFWQNLFLYWKERLRLLIKR